MSVASHLLTMRYLPSNSKLVLSFPKSGNTYFRLVVANYIRLYNGCKCISSFEDLNISMPEYGRPDTFIKESNLRFNDKLFVKSHNSVYSKFSKGVFIYRSFKDVTSSYVRYSERRMSNSMAVEQVLPKMDRFCRDIKYSNLHFINYNDLIYTPNVVMFDALNRLFECEIDAEILELAIQKSSREVVKGWDKSDKGFITNYSKIELQTNVLEKIEELESKIRSGFNANFTSSSLQK